MLENFLSNIVSGWIGDLIICLALAFGGGAMIAWIKAKRPQWEPPLKAGIWTVFMILGMGLMITIWRALPVPIVKTTSKTVLTDVRRWLDEFHYGVRILPEDPARFFGLAVATANGRTLVVSRTRDRDQYLTIENAMTVDGVDRDAVARLSDAQRQELIESVIGSLSLAKTGVIVTGNPFNTILIQKRVPIEALTESYLIDNLVVCP